MTHTRQLNQLLPEKEENTHTHYICRVTQNYITLQKPHLGTRKKTNEPVNRCSSIRTRHWIEDWLERL